MPRTPLEEPLPIESWFDTHCLDSSELRCALRQWGERVSVVVGAEATELVGELALGLRLEATYEELLHTIHAHPTMAEGIMEAAGEAFGEAINI